MDSVPPGAGVISAAAPRKHHGAGPERVAVIMRTNRMRTCVAVSDAYHVFRIRKLLEHESVQVFVAPRPDSRPRSAWQRGLAVLREAASYTAWRLHIPA